MVGGIVELELELWLEQNRMWFRYSNKLDTINKLRQRIWLGYIFEFELSVFFPH